VPATLHTFPHSAKERFGVELFFTIFVPVTVLYILSYLEEESHYFRLKNSYDDWARNVHQRLRDHPEREGARYGVSVYLGPDKEPKFFFFEKYRDASSFICGQVRRSKEYRLPLDWHFRSENLFVYDFFSKVDYIRPLGRYQVRGDPSYRGR